MSEQKSFRDILGEAVGIASMCWSVTPRGVFDSSRAGALVDGLMVSWDFMEEQLKEAIAERDALKAEVEALKKWNDECLAKAEACLKSYGALKARVERLLGALEFYADSNNWNNSDEGVLIDSDDTYLSNYKVQLGAKEYGGKRARAALAADYAATGGGV